MMVVLFKLFQRHSKAVSNPFPFPYLFSFIFNPSSYFCFPTKFIFLPKICRDKNFLFLLLPFTFFLFLSSFFSCQKSTAPLVIQQISLTAEYVGVTEAEIQLRTENIESHTEFRLLRDDSLINEGYLNTSDTLLTDTLLLPAQTYSYQAQLLRNGQPAVFSQPLQITTMDTTSHDFQWEVLQFGRQSSSYFEDVVIVNENDIWAVGAIFADSAQPWLPYNAVHWDGQRWELRRIPFIGSCSAVDYPPIRAIWAFSDDNILFTNGGAIARYNGSTTFLDCGMNALLDGAIKKIFATDTSNIYAVGGVGTIVRYDGQQWQRIESGTNEHINDIYGINDTTKRINKIYCAAGDVYNSLEGKVLRIKPDLTVEDFPWVEQTQISSVWLENEHRIYACGQGIWTYKENRWHQYENIDGGHWFYIRGNSANDIFVCGDFGYIAHFNGLDWKSYRFPNNNLLVSIAVKEDLVVAVSWTGGIIVGKRNFKR